MPRIAYKNFTGGEVSPTLTGRYDLERYATSAQCVENMLPGLHGDAARQRQALRSDDFVLLHHNKAELWRLLAEIRDYLTCELQLTLNCKTRIFPASHGVTLRGIVTGQATSCRASATCAGQERD